MSERIAVVRNGSMWHVYTSHEPKGPTVTEPAHEWIDFDDTDPRIVAMHRVLENGNQCVPDGLWCEQCGKDAKRALAGLLNHFAAEGLTVTAADHELLADLDWSISLVGGISSGRVGYAPNPIHTPQINVEHTARLLATLRAAADRVDGTDRSTTDG